MTALEERPDDQAGETELSGPACTGDSDLGCWMDETGAALADMSHKFRAFNNRLQHMARDLSGMSLELSDVTDDVADVRDTTRGLKLDSTRQALELEKVRTELARLTMAVEKLTGS